MSVLERSIDQGFPSNPGFSPTSLGELASTIRDRGVKSPISVREHPEMQGRYIINHGARRYRASKLAQQTAIPAFIDNDYLEIDQVIENLQRNALTAREIADFIGRELAKGIRKGVIAQSLGKSRAFVTQHAALLDLPDPIAVCFNRGRVRDVTVVNELLQAFKQDAESVRLWLEDESQELTRKSVKLLREFLNAKHHQAQDGTGEELRQDDAKEAQHETTEELSQEKMKLSLQPEANTPKRWKSIVRISHNGRAAHLLLNRRPKTEGWAWICYEIDKVEIEVDLSCVKIIALTEA